MRSLPRALIAALLLLVAVAAIGWFAHRNRVQWAAARASTAQAQPTLSATTAAPRHAEWLGVVQNKRLSELSGLAVSRRRDDLLFAVNDSGDDPLLYALGTDGGDRGVARVQGATNVDWEDLAAFVVDGKPYLLIADVGDNFAWRSEVTLYVVPEPQLASGRFARDAIITPSQVLRIRYPDGAKDCEAVAVDPNTHQILLLSKRTTPPMAYAVALPSPIDRAQANAPVLVAQRVAAVPIPELRARGFGDESWTTSMDIAADGSRAVVITYRDAFFFEKRTGESWSSAFGRAPSRLRMPRMRGMEAIAFAPDGQTIYASSEGLGPPLYRLDAPATR